MKRIACIILIVILCLNSFPAFAQEKAGTEDLEKLKLKLAFDSNPGDIGLKNQVKRYVQIRMKQLGNIVFKDKDYDFELIFFVFEPKDKAGEGTGIVVISVIATEPLPDGRPIFIGDTFKVCNRGDLPKACELLVDQINSEFLARETKTE